MALTDWRMQRYPVFRDATRGHEKFVVRVRDHHLNRGVNGCGCLGRQNLELRSKRFRCNEKFPSVNRAARIHQTRRTGWHRGSDSRSPKMPRLLRFLKVRESVATLRDAPGADSPTFRSAASLPLSRAAPHTGLYLAAH